MIDAVARAPLLATEHLLLRELRADDARAIAVRAGDRKVARYLLAVPSPYPVSLAARWIAGRQTWWAQGRGVTLGIVRRSEPDELLGSVSLRRFARDRRAELGYWLGTDAWGRGYATEAAGALVDFGFREMNLARIYAQVLAGNAASCRVLEKLGMQNEGIRRRHVRKGRTLHDIVLYGILRDEWRGRR
ncbi:MAG TPA: GNAT family protein [Kofleriaceae bacterium]|nr:GNAT family protein [Kofleriaceae bacterium]